MKIVNLLTVQFSSASFYFRLYILDLSVVHNTESVEKFIFASVIVVQLI